MTEHKWYTPTSVRPKIVCLYGSTRFFREYMIANHQETMKGNIVLSVGFYANSSIEMEQIHGEGVGITTEDKSMLDELHKRKIDLADEILVLDVGFYIGPSTQSEVNYARNYHKPVRFWSKEYA